MTLTYLRLVEGTFTDNTRAFGATLSKINGRGPSMRLGKNESTGLAQAFESEADFLP